MAIEIRRIQTSAEIEQVMRLRYQVYVEEEGRFGTRPPPSQRIFDRFDSFEESTNFLALVDEQPAGFLRLSGESPIGSPLDEHYDLSTLRSRCATRPATVNMLGVRRRYRDKGVAHMMMNRCIQALRQNNFTDVMVVINCEIQPMLEKMALQTVGTPFFCHRVGQLLVRMHAPVTALPVLKTAPPEGLEHANRMHLSDGEVLYRQGELGGKVWIILSGTIALSVQQSRVGHKEFMRLEKGALVGHLAQDTTVRRMSTAKAVGRTELVEVPSSMLSRLQHLPSELESIHPGNKAIQSEIGALVGVLEKAPPVSGVSLFNDYLTCRVVHLLGELGFFRRIAGRQQFGAQVLAEELNISEPHLEALMSYLVHAGLVTRHGRGYHLEADRRAQLEEQLGFIQWLIGAYEPVLDGMNPLVTGAGQYGKDIRRNDREVASSSAAISRVYTDPYMFEVLAMDNIKLIADIGTGSAWRLIEICRRFPDIQAIGLDLSAECCRLARENAQREGMEERIQIVEGRAEDWLKKAKKAGIASVDLVTCFAMFHDLLNVPGAAEKFMRDLRKGVREGGYLLIQDQLRLKQTTSDESWVPGFELIHHFMGQKLFPRETYVKIFAEAGWVLERVVETPIPENCLFLLRASGPVEPE